MQIVAQQHLLIKKCVYMKSNMKMCGKQHHQRLTWS